MDPGCPTYEDAAGAYLSKFSALIQPAQQSAEHVAGEAVPEPYSELLTRRAEEIAELSSGTIELAEGYLNSDNPLVREGIRYHFIDQAAAELLFAVELLHMSEEKTGIPSSAAMEATHSAAFREAISAVEKSSSAPIAQGLPAVAPCRSSDSATVDEAVSGLRLAVGGTARNISHRVQELGGDIAFDLVTGMQWTEVIQGASLSVEEIRRILESIDRGSAGKILLHVYRKIIALLDKEVAEEAPVKIREWLDRIKQADRSAVFSALVDRMYNVEALENSVSDAECSGVPLDSINRTSDLIKGLSDRFMVLIDRMRKLEDAIRLGKLIENPQYRLVTAAFQVALLSALVYSGQYYIRDSLIAILRERNLLVVTGLWGVD